MTGKLSFLLHPIFNLLLISMLRWLVVDLILQSLWQIGLVHMSSWIVVRVKIGLSVTKCLGPAIMGILNVASHCSTFIHS